MFRYLMCTCLVLVLIAGSIPLPATAEALPSLSSLNLFYRMSKNRVKDDESLKAQFSDVDARLRKLRSANRLGEMRRQLARGLAIANGGIWDETEDFGASLVVRTDHAYVDSSKPVMLRLEQIYSSTLEHSGSVTARATLHKPGKRARRWARQPGDQLLVLGERPGVGIDLIESPLAMQFDFSSTADGDYNVRFELFDGDDSLGSAFTQVRLRTGLDVRMATLRQNAAKAPQELQADVLYPLDYMRRIGVGWVALRGFDGDAELTAAEEIATAALEGKNPFANRTGNFERHYLLEEAGEIMPYRVYVPTDYSKSDKYPLIVALHGLGGTEDSMFREFYGMTALAEERGYILIAPLGYRIDGGYGGFGQEPLTRRSRLSEEDVMQVLARIRSAYNIDQKRIYLMGHSMGAIGTWGLASRHPDIWAGLGPIAGFGDPNMAEVIRHIPQIVVHGDADLTVPVTGSERMVAALKKVGADVEFIKVPGGGHSDIAPANMKNIFDFFDSHRASKR